MRAYTAGWSLVTKGIQLNYPRGDQWGVSLGPFERHFVPPDTTNRPIYWSLHLVRDVSLMRRRVQGSTAYSFAAPQAEDGDLVIVHTLRCPVTPISGQPTIPIQGPRGALVVLGTGDVLRVPAGTLSLNAEGVPVLKVAGFEADA
jgi:hypothetical protein